VASQGHEVQKASPAKAEFSACDLDDSGWWTQIGVRVKTYNKATSERMAATPSSLRTFTFRISLERVRRL
jgi:hypothetical protein